MRKATRKNQPQCAEVLKSPTPQAIMDEIAALESESAAVLSNIKALL